MQTEQIRQSLDDVVGVADGFTFAWKRRDTLPIILPAFTAATVALLLEAETTWASDGNDETHIGDWQEGFMGPYCGGTINWQEDGMFKCTDLDHQAEMAAKTLATPTPKEWVDLPGDTGIQVTKDTAQGGAVVCVGSSIIGLLLVSWAIHKAIRG